jgi:hypothetical protein
MAGSVAPASLYRPRRQPFGGPAAQIVFLTLPDRKPPSISLCHFSFPLHDRIVISSVSVYSAASAAGFHWSRSSPYRHWLRCRRTRTHPRTLLFLHRCCHSRERIINVRIFTRRSLQELNSILVCQCPTLLCGHNSLLRKIRFIPHQNPANVRRRKAIHFFHPVVHVIE